MVRPAPADPTLPWSATGEVVPATAAALCRPRQTPRDSLLNVRAIAASQPGPTRTSSSVNATIGARAAAMPAFRACESPCFDSRRYRTRLSRAWAARDDLASRVGGVVIDNYQLEGGVSGSSWPSTWSIAAGSRARPGCKCEITTDIAGSATCGAGPGRVGAQSCQRSSQETPSARSAAAASCGTGRPPRGWQPLSRARNRTSNSRRPMQTARTRSTRSAPAPARWPA